MSGFGIGPGTAVGMDERWRYRGGSAPAASSAVGSKRFLRGLQEPPILASAETIGSTRNNRSSPDTRNSRGIHNSRDTQSSCRTVVAAWSQRLQ